MARHVNQRALTVNPHRENPNPQPRPETPRSPVMDDLVDDIDPYESPARLSGNMHLLLTGFSRAGGRF